MYGDTTTATADAAADADDADDADAAADDDTGYALILPDLL